MVGGFEDGEGRGNGGDNGGTFTAAAAWPGGLRSVERFAAVGDAGGGRGLALTLCRTEWVDGGGDSEKPYPVSWGRALLMT